jgi:hypothetical protein
MRENGEGIDMAVLRANGQSGARFRAVYFGVCLVRPRRELCVRWQAIGHKDEEAVLCAKCVPPILSPGPRGGLECF